MESLKVSSSTLPVAIHFVDLLFSVLDFLSLFFLFFFFSTLFVYSINSVSVLIYGEGVDS